MYSMGVSLYMVHTNTDTDTHTPVSITGCVVISKTKKFCFSFINALCAHLHHFALAAQNDPISSLPKVKKIIEREKNANC